MRTYKWLGACVLASAAALFAVSPSFAADKLVSSSNGSLSASALFHNDGGNLVVTLINTSTADVLQPTDILTAVLFQYSGTLSPVSALLNTSAVAGVTNVVVPSVVTNDPDGQPAGGVVGGEWEYLKSTAINTATAGKENNGISSSGLSPLFGSPNFPGSNLDDPPALDGANYGIASFGDNPNTHNGGANTPLIQNSVVFTLSGFGVGTDAQTAIGNVAFVYGTAVGEGCIGDCGGGFVPEPAFYQSSALLGLGVLGLLRLRRRTPMAA